MQFQKLGSWVRFSTLVGVLAGSKKTHDARGKGKGARKAEAAKKKKVARVVEEDISLVIKQVVVEGHGIGRVSVFLAVQCEK